MIVIEMLEGYRIGDKGEFFLRKSDGWTREKAEVVSEAFSKGVEAGKEEWREEVWSEGYDEGYEAGKEDTIADIKGDE